MDPACSARPRQRPARCSAAAVARTQCSTLASRPSTTANSRWRATCRRRQAKGQLELFFQPKIDARRLEVVSVEALLRWRHPTHGLVSPARFVPIAERQGLIDVLGQWVLEGALKQAASWRKAGLGFGVAVNIAGGQFRRDDFAASLARALKTHGLPADRLVCEIAEAVALEDTEATRLAFGRLHKLGVRIAIGGVSGHAAGLTALAQLPVHEVKIDRSLVAAAVRGAAGLPRAGAKHRRQGEARGTPGRGRR